MERARGYIVETEDRDGLIYCRVFDKRGGALVALFALTSALDPVAITDAIHLALKRRHLSVVDTRARPLLRLIRSRRNRP